MPLLSDAKTCFVGTQPITTIMAGTNLVWQADPDGRNCDDTGKPVKPLNFAVATFSGNASQYVCEWSRGSTTTGWKTTTEIKLAGSAAWTNAKTVEYPAVNTFYNKTEFGPDATTQRQTEVRAKNIDPLGNESCYVYTFPLN